MSGTLTVEGKVDVRCTKEAAWDLFCRFGDIAALIPSVEEVEVDGDRVHARVATKLGALAVSSRVTLEVVERKPLECLKARGVSYLGETIEAQIPKAVEGVSSDSAGQLLLHLDLRPGDEEGTISVLYTAEVQANGRLRRIYRAVLKTKVPSMMEEFASNIRGALESEGGLAEEAPPGEPARAAAEPAPSASTDPAPAREPAAIVPAPRGFFARFVAWLRRLFGLTRGTA